MREGRARIAVLHVAPCLLLMLVAGSCAPEATPEPAKRSAAPDTISILYTCDTRGNISPCNCSAGIAGGIARRKTHIDKHRNGTTLIVDVGDNTAGGRPWELLELEYILRGYAAIGYHAVNIGKREAGLPLDALKNVVAQHPFFVSANVTEKDGTPIAPAYRMVTLEGGYEVAILGIVDNTLLPDEIGEGISITPPEEAIAKTLPEITAKTDFIVLLAFASDEAMKSLAERFFELDAIIGGEVEQPSGDPIVSNKSSIAYVTDKGKSVGKLDMRYIGGHFVAEKNEIEMLLDSVPDDPAVAAIVSEFKLKQTENNFPTKKEDEDGLTSILPAS